MMVMMMKMKMKMKLTTTFNGLVERRERKRRSSGLHGFTQLFSSLSIFFFCLIYLFSSSCKL